jgi:hypothetical protein
MSGQRPLGGEPLRSPDYYERLRKPMPDNLTEFRKDFKRTEQAIDDLSGGSVRTSGEFDVTVSVTTTTIVHYGVSSRSVVLLMPLDLATATEYALGTTFVTPEQGQFVVTHPNNGSARSYRYVFFSGKLNP